jgi:uroporphyrinogen-III synthase
MHKTLDVQVRTIRLKLSQRNIDALKRIETYDWILFTSKNAAGYFAAELRERKIPRPKRPRIATVGKITKDTLRRLKITVHVVPSRATVKDLVKYSVALEVSASFFPAPL